MAPRHVTRTGWTLALALPALLIVFPGSFAAEKARPAEWAAPVRLEGVPNLHRVTPDLYRSGQPTLGGFENLKTLGIRTVVNLRGGDDDLRASIEVGFRPEHIALSALRIRPSSNVRILRVLGAPGRGPTLFHCRRGAERAGMICALYRMVFQGWDREQAIEEMQKGGYGFRWYYRGLINYLRDVDVEALRKEVAAAPGGAI
jgi:protein tyrosine/serine phosphatase